MDRAHLAELVASRLRDVNDFPKPRVVSRSTPLLADPVASARSSTTRRPRYDGRVDLIAGIEARGFMTKARRARSPSASASRSIRKKGKLPAATAHGLRRPGVRLGDDRGPPGRVPRAGSCVLVMDDVLATGGTAAAACQLIERSQAQVVAVDVVCEIGFLRGRDRLTGYDVESLLTI